MTKHPVPEHDYSDEPDWWLEAMYEDRTHIDDDNDSEFNDAQDWGEWDDDEAEFGEDDGSPSPEDDPDATGSLAVLCRAIPADFHALDQAIHAPLQQKINDALTSLSEQLAAGHTEHFRKLMRFYAKFYHSYSLANTILIMLAKPDASVVAGYKRWQRLGRQVRTGVKSAQIWCPVFRKQTDEITGEEVRRLVGFRTGYVFSDKDLVDWDTNPVPTDRPPLPDTYPDLLTLVREKVVASGVTIRDVPHIAKAHGYYNRVAHEIVLEEGRDSHNQILILLHEWAHALFHRDGEDWPKAQKEFEAETTAMVVGELLGVESPVAGDYLLTFGITPEQLVSSFSKVQSLIKTMIGALGLTGVNLDDLDAA